MRPSVRCTASAWMDLTGGGPPLPPQEVPDDSGGRAVPFGYWDSVLIALLVLVVMALTVGNLVLRKLRRRAHGPEEWDSLTEEEWEGRP